MTDFKEILDAIVTTTGDGIISADSDGNIVAWNPACERVLGYAEEDAVGRPLTLIIPERFRQQHHDGLARVVSSGETRIIGKTVEVAAIRKDGVEIPIELSLSTWMSEGKRHFTAILRDLSAKAALITTLRDSEARLEAILEAANDAIVTVDSEGKVLQWNSFAEQLFGRGKKEMLGHPLTSIIPERFRHLHESGLQRVAAGGETHVIGRTVELAGLDRNGREIPIELSLAAWKTDGETYFSGIIRDITERKSAEEDLRQVNTALADKNEMLEGLSAKLAKYLSRQVYDSIFEGKTDVDVASYRKNLTIFFSDIQGFTELSDRMEPEPVSRLLNGYLSEMSDVAMEFGGTVDKFIGDGIMIFFGDPESKGEKEDALACARMALAMRARIGDSKKSWSRETGSVDLHVRMGINTGFCTVGNFGSANRLDYTIVGREVNTASRLESAARPDQILVAHDTYELIKDEFHCQPVGEIKVKGLAYPVRTFELIGVAVERDRQETSVASETITLDLDTKKMAPEAVRATREALKRALASLDEAESDKDHSEPT